MKKSRRKKGKAQVQAEIEAAEAHASKLEDRIEQVEGELMKARLELSKASSRHQKAQHSAECAQKELERRVEAFQAEAREKRAGGLQEIALLTMELEELRGNDWEAKYKTSTEQVGSSTVQLISP